MDDGSSVFIIGVIKYMKLNKRLKIKYWLLLIVFNAVLNPFVYSQTNNQEAVNYPTPLKFFGDFRYRFQNEQDGDDDERAVNKLRLKINGLVGLSEAASLSFRLMSYSKPESSATSGNFNMGDSSGYGFQRRMIGIDQVFADYHPLPELKIQLGKIPMSLNFAGKSQMILDSDLSPEGAMLNYKQTIFENWEYYINFAYYVIAENYGSGTPKKEETDNVIYAPQVGLKFPWANWQWQLMLSKIYFSALKGDLFNHTCCTSSTSAKGRGNSEGLTPGTYLYDYDVNELGIEAKTKIDDYQLTLFIQKFYNAAVKEKNQGSWLGLTIANGPFGVTYAQGSAESDSTPAAFTDADLAKGETDSVGTQWVLQYKLNPYWSLALTKYDSEYKRSTSPMHYKRTSIDTTWAF